MSNRAFIIDRSATIYLKEIWNKDVTKGMDITDFNRDELIDKHLRFVYSLAAKQCPHFIPFSEFIGESNLGLVEEANAAVTPEQRKFFRNHVKIRIKRMLSSLYWKESTSVKITKTYVDYFKKAKRELERLKKELESENIGYYDVYNRLDSIEFPDFLKEVNPFYNQNIEASVNDDGESFLYEVIPSDDKDPDSLLNDNYYELKDKLLVIFKRVLNDLEFHVITETFGLLREAKTLQQITGVLGISSKRVYEAYHTAISKLRKEDIKDMLLAVRDLDVSRYTDFESINAEFEKRYFKLLENEYKSKDVESPKALKLEEIAWLRENYSRVKRADAIKYLNDRREDSLQLSEGHFKRLIANLNLTSSKFWLEGEIEYLEKNYGFKTDKEIADFLTQNNPYGKVFNTDQVKNMASRLKIKKNVV